MKSKISKFFKQTTAMFFAVLLVLSLLFSLTPVEKVVAAGPNGMSGQGIIGVPYLIEDCLDFQAIDQDLTAYYELNNDIDCSDTINWNSGEGFRPIGWDADENIREFTGNLNGKSHTVSDIFIDLSAKYRSRVGVFEQLGSGSEVLDIVFQNTDITAPQINQYHSVNVGGVAGNANYGSVIDDVRIQVANIDIPCSISNEHYANIGGVVGFSNGSITRTLISGLYTNSSNCSNQIIASGGIAGVQDSGKITDCWAQINNSHDSQSSVTEYTDFDNAPHQLGGLVGYAKNTEISQTYSAGLLSVNYTPGEWQNWNVGGLVGSSENTQISNSFTTIAISVNASCNGSECDYGVTNLGYIVGSNLTNEEYSGNYYDEINFGPTAFCDGEGSTSCTAVNTIGSPDPNYFLSQITNPPMNTWDFVDNWNEGCPGCAPGVPGYASVYPAPANNLNTEIVDETSIKIKGTQGYYAPISSTLRTTKILQKKSTENDWTLTNYSFNMIPSEQFESQITGLEPGTDYDFKIVTEIDRGYYTVSSQFSGRTSRVGFTLISDCLQLQDIEMDLTDKYELGNNIDCSDTINWNGGLGFDSIGYMSFDYSQIEQFEGIFAGNNFTISNLYMDNTGISPITGLFATTANARIQDLRIVNMTQIAGQLGGGGSLIGVANNSSITNVQINGGIAEGPLLSYGGLVGVFIGGYSEIYEITKSSYSGTVTISDTIDDPNTFENYGGLVGQIGLSSNATLNIINSYSVNNLYDISGLLTRSGVVGFALVDSDSNLNISKVYSSGNMHFENSYPFMNIASGIIGISIGDSVSIGDSFSYLDLTDGVGLSGRGGIVGVNLNGMGEPLVRNFNDVYFDTDLASTLDCDQYQSTTCNKITGSPNYFFNNATNPPLNTWDFDNIWQTTNTLPVFGQKLSETISIIPQEYLEPKTNPQPNSNNGGSPIPPTPAEQKKVIEKAFQNISDINNDTDNKTPTLLEKIADKVKELLRTLPEPVVKAFPFVLFGMILLGIIFMIFETRRQAQRLYILKGLISKQRSIAQQRDTFWHLAANYLRAPVTLLMGGAELLQLEDKKDKHTEKIVKLVKNMQAKVAGIMDDIEKSQTLKGISWPKNSGSRSIFTSISFWVPITLLAFLLVLANYVAVGFRKFDVSTFSYLTQIVFFGLVVYGLYWGLGGLRGMKRKVTQAESLISRQSKALKRARSDLVNQSATALDAGVSELQITLNKLPKSEAKQPLIEGSRRLRNIVDTFQLLNATETDQLDKISPAGSHSQIDSVLEQLISNEQESISTKKLTLDTPRVTKLEVPGSARLTQQVVGSVLDNAIAFSPSGSTVAVELISKPGQQGIAIHDQGQGVSKEQLAHMFEPFTKADGDDALRMNHEGLGVDLYLNKLILEHLGGSISAKSSDGKGTKISMWWPKNV